MVGTIAATIGKVILHAIKFLTAVVGKTAVISKAIGAKTATLLTKAGVSATTAAAVSKVAPTLAATGIIKGVDAITRHIPNNAAREIISTPIKAGIIAKFL